MKKGKLFFTAAIAWFITSVVLLTLPGTAFPKEDWLDKIWFDKWVHIGMFGLLVLLWSLGFKYYKAWTEKAPLARIFRTIAIVFFVYGIVMEFVQLWFIPLRSFDFGDIVADGVGCGLGLIFVTRWSIKK